MIQTIVTDILVLMILTNRPAVEIVEAEPVVQAVPVPSPGLESMVEVLEMPEEKPVKNNIGSTGMVVTARKPAAGRPAPAEIDALIDQYASQYGVDAQKMKTIAACESGYRPEALSANGLYGGMYQFVSSTWTSNRLAMGLDPNPELRFDAAEAIKTAAFKMGRDGYGAWPVCGVI